MISNGWISWKFCLNTCYWLKLTLEWLAKIKAMVTYAISLLPNQLYLINNMKIQLDSYPKICHVTAQIENSRNLFLIWRKIQSIYVTTWSFREPSPSPWSFMVIFVNTPLPCLITCIWMPPELKGLIGGLRGSLREDIIQVWNFSELS